MYGWLTLRRLPFTPLHRLWIHFLQLWHKIKLLPTPFWHITGPLTFLFHLIFHTTTRHYLRFSCIHLQNFCFQPDFHFMILSRTSLSAIKIKSCAYSNCRGKPARSFLDFPLLSVVIGQTVRIWLRISAWKNVPWCPAFQGHSTARFRQFYSSVRRDNVAIYRSIWTQFPHVVIGHICFRTH